MKTTCFVPHRLWVAPLSEWGVSVSPLSEWGEILDTPRVGVEPIATNQPFTAILRFPWPRSPRSPLFLIRRNTTWKADHERRSSLLGRFNLDRPALSRHYFPHDVQPEPQAARPLRSFGFSPGSHQGIEQRGEQIRRRLPKLFAPVPQCRPPCVSFFAGDEFNADTRSDSQDLLELLSVCFAGLLQVCISACVFAS